jgi:hypothetical protein
MIGDPIPRPAAYRYDDGLLHFVTVVDGNNYTLCHIQDGNHCRNERRGKARMIGLVDCPDCLQVITQIKEALEP